MRVEVPTLVIWGAEDRLLLPGLTDGLDEWVPDVRVEILAGAGHWIPQERADEVNTTDPGVHRPAPKGSEPLL